MAEGRAYDAARERMRDSEAEMRVRRVSCNLASEGGEEQRVQVHVKPQRAMRGVREEVGRPRGRSDVD